MSGFALLRCNRWSAAGEERLVVVEVVGMSWVLPGVNVTSIGWESEAWRGT